jgi:SulP family sulfate permease
MKPKLITTLKGYTLRGLLSDSIAGVTVALVALPLSIAIAIASGAPPASGPVTAIVAGFLVSALGGSRVQIGGPTGAFIVVVYGVIQHHGYDGLLVATMMAGAILLAAGLLRIGRLIRHVPDPVIEGFTIGIAVVIAASQIRDLAGLDTGPLAADFVPKVAALWAAKASVHWPALALGLATIAAMLVMRKVAPKLPSLPVIVGLGSVIAALLLPGIETVTSRYGDLPSGLPWPAMPQVSSALLVALLPSAFTIAFLAGIESLLSAKVADNMIGGAHRSDAELLAQAAANLASPLFGGLPATGAIARTATNVNAGGRTPVAGIVHALVILLAVAFAAGLVGALALPVLAGLLVTTAWNMSEPHRWRERMQLPRTDLALLALTAVLTIFADLTIAIVAGTVIGLALSFARRFSPSGS